MLVLWFLLASLRDAVVWSDVSGGVAALNYRLIAKKPPACFFSLISVYLRSSAVLSFFTASSSEQRQASFQAAAILAG